jgi:L-iditol 2-dehydrogenase
MKALSYRAWDTLEVCDQAKPAPAEGEVLLRVSACGLCGSELEGFRTRSPRRTPPLVMGHEFCGVVDGIGAAVNGFSVGQKVVSNALVSCGRCVRCERGDSHLCASRQIFGMNRQGAFAEYVNVPARCLLPWPRDLPAEAACLAEPLANGVHVARLVEHLRPRNVLVIGAGPIGLMCLGAARAMLGADVFVTDLNEPRLAFAKAQGAREIFPASSRDVVEAMRALTDGEGADVVIDAVGAAATKQQSILATRPGGAAVWIGLHDNPVSFNSYDVTLPEKQVLGSYAATMDEMHTALDLMATGKVDPLPWVQRFPIERGVEAFRRMLTPQGDDVKAVIVPS